MTTQETNRLPEWSPVVYAFFVAIPMCCALLGGVANLPLAATALCLPLAATLGWFFDWKGVVSSGVLAGLGLSLPEYFVNDAAVDWGTSVTCSIVIFAFAWMGARLRGVIDGAHHVAGTDSLTGLNNRNRLLERLEEEANRAIRNGECISVAYLDCDRFKNFNDTKGHLAGDALLVESARILARSVRNYDIVARMGGDEFSIVFLESNHDVAQVIAQRVHDQLSATANEKGWDVSWSMGVAVFPQPFTAKEMLHIADQLMYQVKNGQKGRFLIETYEKEAGKTS